LNNIDGVSIYTIGNLVMVRYSLHCSCHGRSM